MLLVLMALTCWVLADQNLVFRLESVGFTCCHFSSYFQPHCTFYRHTLHVLVMLSLLDNICRHSNRIGRITCAVFHQFLEAPLVTSSHLELSDLFSEAFIEVISSPLYEPVELSFADDSVFILSRFLSETFCYQRRVRRRLSAVTDLLGDLHWSELTAELCGSGSSLFVQQDSADFICWFVAIFI